MIKDWIELLKQEKQTAEENYESHGRRATAGHAAGDWDEENYFGGRRKEAEFWVGYFSARLHTATLYPVTRILRDGQPVAEFTDASLARMAALMFAENEAANGNAAHQWTVEGD